MIVVTAPTGQIGQRVVARLLAANARVRVVVRDPARLPAGVREAVEVVEGSHRDRDVARAAFDGASSVFWLVPPDPRADSVDEAFAGFTRAAAEAWSDLAVPRVVGVSALGRGSGQEADAGYATASLAMDDLVAASGVAYRALTCPGFMDNVARQFARIRDGGVLTSPFAGHRERRICATRDIADMAADLLLDDSWTDVEERPVLGPVDLSFDRMAAILTEVLGRPVRHRRMSLDDYRASLLGVGMSTAMAEGVVDMARAKSSGLDDAVVRTPGNTTPTGFRQWCDITLRPLIGSSR